MNFNWKFNIKWKFMFVYCCLLCFRCMYVRGELSVFELTEELRMKVFIKRTKNAMWNSVFFSLSLSKLINLQLFKCNRIVENQNIRLRKVSNRIFCCRFSKNILQFRKLLFLLVLSTTLTQRARFARNDTTGESFAERFTRAQTVYSINLITVYRNFGVWESTRKAPRKTFPHVLNRM